MARFTAAKLFYTCLQNGPDYLQFFCSDDDTANILPKSKQRNKLEQRELESLSVHSAKEKA